MASVNHNFENNGANISINNGFIDWKNATGTVHPNKLLLVAFSANNVKVVPACSNPAQKNTTNDASINITATLFFSCLVKGFFSFATSFLFFLF